MDDDFERRRELRRQKREEMRLEAERMAYHRNEEDEEEAARERRRRARQERMRSKDSEDVAYQPETPELNNSHSVTVTESVSTSVVTSSGTGEGDDEEQALLERLAKRVERRQKRMKEALDRQEDLESSQTSRHSLEESSGGLRHGRSYEPEEEHNSKEEVKQVEEEEEEEVLVEEKPRRSYLREQESVEEIYKVPEEANNERDAVPSSEVHEVLVNEDADDSAVVSETENGTAELAAGVQEEKSEIEGLTENGVDEMREAENFEKDEVSENDESFMEDEDVMRKNKQPNGGVCEDSTPKHKKAERTFSRGSLRSPEAPEADEVDSEDARLEAERKLEELKRRRDEMESEEFERMRQKQQEAEVELEELKRKREERRKVLEEEEQRRKQEEAERKARDEEEKRRMKEEIEKRRAEAAEKRQKVEDSEEGEARKPFKCVSPRGSSLKIGERAEFLNRSAQKSSVKASHAPVVSKIDNRLEQYTSAVQGHKEVRSPRSAAIDLPIVTDGIRNIKSMWEKGNVFSSGGSPASTNKDAAGIKVGVAGRINDWLNKTPETGKTSGGRPADLKPGDVTSKRNLWENKGSSATKVASRGETKSVTNGTGH
ncbi:non-muscle caldesmon-like isoform X1 [Sinocyclocheilus anshuiensis]|uniref:non-muscle caldesmon-like isoform X1 n=1 Tax=Sinocyclocheilus anshuiensis TaxID=1608454 RepID=UPI0007B79F6E|nr:PREDICTED: non-muscle caldesmon-like isoform X1 [Sinocyclocheilus anshuiensis]XP_016303076.1 PREDICTED: non-muscle caldesmon-like isoform X1 [Sinocyclocheilus anshuiensis]XP_016303077.1 PREDICTED: non-muscle caldesmon-like isoform X1 [Sinocyclocheilus anshuiensis]